MEKHQELTRVRATLAVETEKRRGDLATCAHTSRWRAERGTGASPHRWWASWIKQRECKVEGVNASLRSQAIELLSLQSYLSP